MALTAYAFRMDVELRVLLKRQLQFFAEVAQKVPVKRCRVRSDLSALEPMARAVLADAGLA
jgi:hypothetical protein